MDFVSRDHLLLSQIKKDKKITWFNYFVFGLIWLVCLAFIVLNFFPSSWNETTVERLGFWTSYFHPNQFFFGWLNILMLFITIGSILLLIGILYLSFYKAHRKILTWTGYMAIIGFLALILPLGLIGQLAILGESRWIYKKIGDTANWKLNNYGIVLLVLFCLIYLVTTSFIIHWYVLSIKDKIQYSTPKTETK